MEQFRIATRLLHNLFSKFLRFFLFCCAESLFSYIFQTPPVYCTVNILSKERFKLPRHFDVYWTTSYLSPYIPSLGPVLWFPHCILYWTFCHNAPYSGCGTPSTSIVYPPKPAFNFLNFPPLYRLLAFRLLYNFFVISSLSTVKVKHCVIAFDQRGTRADVFSFQGVWYRYERHSKN